MGTLAEPTLAVVMNIGAAERKKARRVKAFIVERGEKGVGAGREEGTKREEGDAQQQEEKEVQSSEDMDAILVAVAGAIS